MRVGTKNEATRLKWIEETLKKIPDGSTILDAGAGEQQFKKFCKHLNYVSQDFCQYNGKGDVKALQTKSWDYGKIDIVSDITNIPREDQSFDVIMCTEVFEHIINPEEAIKEFSRLIKKDGYILLTAPFCSLTHFSPYHYYSGFNRYFYETMLKKYGFEIIELTPNGNYFEYIAQEIIRIPMIAKRYSKINSIIMFLLKLIRKLLLKIIELLSNKDSNSAEILCFGYHVFAKRI